jgi:GTP-binding protein
VALPVIKVEEPTVRMTFGVNTSPFAGREGRWRTSQRLRERLFEELKHNVALRVRDTDSADTFLVSGRGELHLAILIETMRREGYEFHVSRPEVILHTEEDGTQMEPYEEVHIEVPPDAVGLVIEMLGVRRGEMILMGGANNDTVALNYIVPTRGLLGFRYQFLTATRGRGIMSTLFHGYGPLAGPIATRSRGSLIAWDTGVSTTYGLRNAEPRGILFIGAGVDVHAGMVVGEHQRIGDLEVNVCKTKTLTAVHTVYYGVDDQLPPPREMSLDECIEYLADDELLEVTPKSLRIRKRILDKNIRDREVKRAKAVMA